MKSYRLGSLLLCALALTLAACDKAAPKSAPAASIPEVKVIQAHGESLPLTRELVGRLAATRTAEVRARVAGIILKRVYSEGTDVESGQTLFQIDPAPLQAEVHAQEATLVKAQADATNAALTAKRYRELAAKKLLSSQDLDSALATERTTAAAVKVAEANLEKARLDLSYATVKAPIAGRAGRAMVTEGALVGQDSATQLTTIEQIDPIYVNFSVSVAQLQELSKADAASGQLRQDGHGVPVEVVLADGTPYEQKGSLDFSDSAADPATGTVSLRAVLPNPQARLLPGMFVNLRLTLGRIEHAFLLPQATLSRDAKGAYVLVVNDKGKVEQRRVTTHGMTTADWIVTGALSDGDQVIVEGLQKVKPGGDAKAVAAAAAEK
ncbi:MAG: efflux RND transporter periplasmic adaptor subunit [Candidatus Thiodiazotropha sp.]